MDKMHEILRNFAKHYTDYIPEIPVLHHIPTASEFLSHYVIPNKPFVISCPENHLPAVTRWQKSFYLEDVIFDDILTVSVTPKDFANPTASCLFPEYSNRYMVPLTRKMSAYTFLCKLKHGDGDPDEYFYVKQQNNLEDFPQIANDIRTDVPWATEALGTGPIAANLSIGNHQNHTSMHKDEYDNFFYVLSGSRHFRLFPPIGHVCIPYKKYAKWQWVKKDIDNKKKFVLEDLNEEIEVIPSVIEPETLEQDGFYRNIKSYVVFLQPGDALYIPALWYHEYYQTDWSFTLNYWYEMKWDWKFPMLRFLSKLFKLKPRIHKDAVVDTQSELEENFREELFDATFKEMLDL